MLALEASAARECTQRLLRGINMKESDAALQTLLADDRFIETARKAVYDIDFPGNAAAYLNDDIDPDRLLYTVILVRRITAKKVGAVTSSVLSRAEKDSSTYCVVTPEIEEKLERLLEKARIEPYASRNLTNHIYTEHFSAVIVDDLAAAAKRDGLDLDYHAIQSLLDSRAACNPREQMVLTAFEVASRHFAKRDQREMLNDPSSFFSELVDSESEPEYGPIRRPPNVYALEIDRDNLRPENLFHAKGKETIESLLMCIEASDCIWEIMPFPRWNGLMEWMLRMFYTYALDLPLLGYVPLSKMMLEWEHGIIAAPRVLFPFGEGTRETEFGVDSSLYFLQILTFLETELDRLLERIYAWQDRVHAVSEELFKTTWLNHRQSSLLSEWLEQEKPGTANVREYAQRFSISPNTARHDLRSLALFGFCSIRCEGKREVYCRSSNLLADLEASLERM